MSRRSSVSGHAEMDSVIIDTKQFLDEQMNALNERIQEKLSGKSNEKQKLYERIRSLENTNAELEARLNDQEKLIQQLLAAQRSATQNTPSQSRSQFSSAVPFSTSIHTPIKPEKPANSLRQNRPASSQNHFIETQPAPSHQFTTTTPISSVNRREPSFKPATAPQSRIPQSSNLDPIPISPTDHRKPSARSKRHENRHERHPREEESDSQTSLSFRRINRLEEDVVSSHRFGAHHESDSHGESSVFSSVLQEIEDDLISEGGYPKRKRRASHQRQYPPEVAPSEHTTRHTPTQRAYPFHSSPPHSDTIGRSPSPPRNRPQTLSEFSPSPDQERTTRHLPRQRRQPEPSQSQLPSAIEPSTFSPQSPQRTFQSPPQGRRAGQSVRLSPSPLSSPPQLPPSQSQTQNHPSHARSSRMDSFVLSPSPPSFQRQHQLDADHTPARDRPQRTPTGRGETRPTERPPRSKHRSDPKVTLRNIRAKASSDQYQSFLLSLREMQQGKRTKEQTVRAVTAMAQQAQLDSILDEMLDLVDAA
ncbi:hypothetical protein BLNAU_5756 [Blattamonas nauphoetae]|uniref:Uncharacterized protein n=1 Tax=Blattamonas nauphoetae TaxID=2049346 RepID=A0ABQ9Y670_9EUKA|nr:hypothetical protein BLNAU_5756 [Blattamonas nauphoetae]